MRVYDDLSLDGDGGEGASGVQEPGYSADSSMPWLDSEQNCSDLESSYRGGVEHELENAAHAMMHVIIELIVRFVLVNNFGIDD